MMQRIQMKICEEPSSLNTEAISFNKLALHCSQNKKIDGPVVVNLKGNNCMVPAIRR